jgi:hypothetical protein
MYKQTCDLHGKMFILLVFYTPWGYKCWVNFILIPLKILKIFRLIFGWSAKENQLSQRSVVRGILGIPTLDNALLANGPRTFVGIASLFVRAQEIPPLNTCENNFDTSHCR